jgi:DNA-binding transcriptional LysR family regulator
MMNLTIPQLQCLDAVVTEGSFQAAAEKIRRSQPSVFSAVKNLESQLGLELLDRSGYRVTLTEAGRSFHERSRVFLYELLALKNHATQLAMGEETELTVVIGDLCPLPQTLALLRRFFDGCPGTRLHLHFEAIGGPWERLLDGEADLILHHIDKSDPRFDYRDLFRVRLVPVAAPGFLKFPVSRSITPERLRDQVQCVIRDTARHTPPRDYFLVEGARTWTVSDQLMKRELILQGMGWGHMPKYLIERDLREKRLLDLTGKHLKGGVAELVAARLRAAPHGPVAARLWNYMHEQSASLDGLTGHEPSAQAPPPAK